MPPVRAKCRLAGPERPWQAVDHLGREAGLTRGDRVAARHADGSDRPLAAGAATRRDERVTVQPGRVNGDAGPQPRLHRVRPGPPDTLEVAGPGDDPLGEEEARRQVHIVARRPHRHRDRGRRRSRGVCRQADLQRLLHRELVGRG